MTEEIEEREWLVLQYIIEHRKAHYNTSPTLRQIHEGLNKVLPPRQKLGKKLPALSGKFQINISVDKLRRVGFIIDPEKTGMNHMHRNYIPTDQGEDYYKKRIRKEKD